YKGIPNSPEATLTSDINSSQTTITVSDANIIPEVPNILVIGGNTDNPETVKVTGKNGNTLTVERGFEAEAQAWEAGTKVSRNFTAYDYNTLIENINDLQQQHNEHKAEMATNAHLAKNIGLQSVNFEANNVEDGMNELKDEVDSKESPSGAQAKANAALNAAKEYTDEEVGKIADDLDTHKADIIQQLSTKVDKVAGKGLSTNDYTDEEKQKNQDNADNISDLQQELETHKAEKATQDGYGHIRLKDIPTPTKESIGLGNVDNVKQMPISGGVLENYREKLITLSGTAPTINLNDGNVFTHSLTGNTTYSITNAVSGQAHSFTLIITQPATARAITFPSSVKWQGGETPNLTSANKTYVLTFLTINGGSTWLGIFGGEF
ncbi:MAG: hypothetical protein GX790_04725, partial [Syntrophomonadaceae bacterium]|nr:hypothetical protein [Syntrophomonadaceae bacterium]